VLNVAGHRLGTMEIESALVAHPRVAEAAVVGKPHEVKGESVFAYVVTRGQRPDADGAALVKELRDWVGQQLGPIAKPDDIRFADNLPKTRSGKIMRRLLKAIARGEEITQDVSTLENPAILDQLRGTQAPPAAAAAAPARARRAAPRVVKRTAAKVVTKRAADKPKRRAKSAKRTARRRASVKRATRRRKVAAASGRGKARRVARAAARRSPAGRRGGSARRRR
jgi:hypothetical protein